jgi:hypothetical protein
MKGGGRKPADGEKRQHRLGFVMGGGVSAVARRLEAAEAVRIDLAKLKARRFAPAVLPC